jgi:hypothetical protein
VQQTWLRSSIYGVEPCAIVPQPNAVLDVVKEWYFLANGLLGLVPSSSAFVRLVANSAVNMPVC